MRGRLIRWLKPSGWGRRKGDEDPVEIYAQKKGAAEATPFKK
jgi:hypothetical protein